MKITWSPRALERVQEITDYIAKDNVEAARLLAIELFGAVERLKDFPRSGRMVPEAGRADIREVIHEKYRIVYRIEKQQVSILTVRHSRQRLPMKEIKATKTK